MCDGDSHICRQCEAHGECFSGVCDAGRCVSTVEIIHMSSNGVDGTNDCTNPAPGMGCRTLTYAIGKVTSTRKYIVLEPSTTPYQARDTAGAAEVSGVLVHIIGYGSAVRRTGDGTVLELRANADVTVEGLAIEYAINGDGVYCSSSSLTLRNAFVRSNDGVALVGSACSLRASRSTFTANETGGLVLTGGSSFNIVNNVIYNNGNITTGIYGGVSISVSTSNNVLEFNTIALNATQSGVVDGVDCTNIGLI